MATEKNGTYKVFNGTDYDIIYLKTILSQIFGPDGRSLSAMLNEDFAPSGFGLGEAGKSISNTDLNDYTLAGFYKGGNLTNAPNTGWFAVFVNCNSGTNAVQILVSLGVGNVGGLMYVRYCVSGTWRDWKIAIYSGDDVSLNSVFVTGNSTGLSNGNGDGCSFSVCNMFLQSWYGIGFKSTFDNVIRAILDTRTGNFTTQGTLTANAGYNKLGKTPAYSWNGTINNNTYVDITHNLGYKPIIDIAGTRGNIVMTHEHLNDNQVRVHCYSGGGANFTGIVNMW